MHSVEFVKRQAAADAALQEKVQVLAKANGQETTFDTAAARGDSNLRRLLLMEQAVAALDALAARKQPAQKAGKAQAPEITEPDDIIVAAVEVTEEAPIAEPGSSVEKPRRGKG